MRSQYTVLRLNEKDMVKLRMVRQRYDFAKNIDAMRYILTNASEEIVKEMFENQGKFKTVEPMPVYS